MNRERLTFWSRRAITIVLVGAFGYVALELHYIGVSGHAPINVQYVMDVMGAALVGLAFLLGWENERAPIYRPVVVPNGVYGDPVPDTSVDIVPLGAREAPTVVDPLDSRVIAMAAGVPEGVL